MKMIQPLIMSCDRDLELLAMLLDSLRALRDPRLLPAVVTFEDRDAEGERARAFLRRSDLLVYRRDAGYGQWGWPSSAILLRIIGAGFMTNHLSPRDFIWKVDSDVVMVSANVFDLLNDADLLGAPHQVLTPTQRFGPWGHLSGASIFLAAEIGRRIGRLSLEQLAEIEGEMRHDGLCVNEDVVLTYAAQYVGARRCDLLEPAIACSDPEGCLLHGRVDGYSVVHLAGERTAFGEHPVEGKWGIPALLRELGRYPSWSKV